MIKTPKYTSIFIPVCSGNGVYVDTIIAIESISKLSRNGNNIEIDTWDGYHYRADDHDSRLFKNLIDHFSVLNDKS